MAQTSKAVYPGMCDVTLGLNGFTDTVVDNMKDSFELNPNYEQVYIIHDSSKHQDFLHDIHIKHSHGLQMYKSWIYEGTEEEQTVGHKYIQMYPYDEIVLQEGDYVAFDYYHDGRKMVWICLALDSTSDYEQIGKIRPCTNEVRFYNDDGVLIRVPCVFDNKINSEKNTTLSNLKYINGITTIYMQLNSDSEQLKDNQRLLFGRKGNWTAFRIVSVGVNNFMNPIYWDNNSAKVLEVTMEASYVNEDTDDLVNGIADAPTYTIKTNVGNAEMAVGETLQATASLFDSYGIPSDKTILWKTSNNCVASVLDGLITAKRAGNCTITAYMQDNEYVLTTIDISVVETKSDNYSIVITPYELESFGILQGNEQTFTCGLYNNGVLVDADFTFELTTDANDSCYKFTTDGNTFTVKNIRMSVYPLNVHCVSGEHDYYAQIILKGAW